MGKNGDTCEMKPRPLSGEEAPVGRPCVGKRRLCNKGRSLM